MTWRATSARPWAAAHAAATDLRADVALLQRSAAAGHIMPASAAAPTPALAAAAAEPDGLAAGGRGVGLAYSSLTLSPASAFALAARHTGWHPGAFDTRQSGPGAGGNVVAATVLWVTLSVLYSVVDITVA
jgi:hypothetical protein